MSAALLRLPYWESASESEDYAPIDQVAEVIRRLHELDAPTDLALPEKQPFDDINSRLPNLAALDPGDAQFLRDRIGELRERYAQLEFELTPGVIHGDANVGDVILDRNGQALLIDLDSFCTGSREWDLVQTALFAAYCLRFVRRERAIGAGVAAGAMVLATAADRCRVRALSADSRRQPEQPGTAGVSPTGTSYINHHSTPKSLLFGVKSNLPHKQTFQRMQNRIRFG